MPAIINRRAPGAPLPGNDARRDLVVLHRRRGRRGGLRLHVCLPRGENISLEAREGIKSRGMDGMGWDGFAALWRMGGKNKCRLS